MNTDQASAAFQIKRILPVCLILAVLCGCAGNYFTFDKARQVKVGMTEQDVRQIMGKPNVMTTRDQSVVWIYAYGTALGTSKSVSYVFTDGKVVQVPTIPDSFK